MINFTLYKLDEEFNIIDLGQGCNNKLSRLLEDSFINYGEGSLSKTSFGIVKTHHEFKCDFLEISVISDDHIDLYSDRLVYPNLWSKFLSTKSHIIIKSDKNNVNSVIDDYLILNRYDFEKKYQIFYAR